MAHTPWWIRIPTRPPGIIASCSVTIAIILCTSDRSTSDVIAAVLAGGCVGFLVQFVQGMAQVAVTNVDEAAEGFATRDDTVCPCVSRQAGRWRRPWRGGPGA